MRPASPEVYADPASPVPAGFGPLGDVEGDVEELDVLPEPGPRGGVRRWLAVVAVVGVLSGAAGGGVVAEVMRRSEGASSPGTVSPVVPAPRGSTGRATGVMGVARAMIPSVVLLEVEGDGVSGEGSGIIVGSNGRILTNNHVVSAAGVGGHITAVFDDGRSAPVSVVGTDPVTDLAVVRAKGVSRLQVARIGSSDVLQVGQQVVAIGAPLGLQGTVTSGIVSALHRPVTTTGENGQGAIFGAIQTDAAINPGNSGGPLVDMRGRVVGIDSAIASLTSTTTSSEAGSIGLGFAIPISQAMPIVSELEQGHTAVHARLGIEVRDSAVPVGARVTSVLRGSSAVAAGLRTGDVITRVNGNVVDDASAFIAAIRAERPGDKVTITYLRGSRVHTTTAVLGSDRSGS